MESHRQIEEHAARLLAKRDSGAWGESDQAQLESWMEQTTAHRVAVLRLEAAWDEARRLKAVAAGMRPGTVPPPGAWRQTPFFDHGPQVVGRLTPRSIGQWWQRNRSRRRPARMLAAAAAILLAIAGGYFVLTTSVLNRGRYVTALGQVASVPLPDGSMMTLNTDSEVRLRYSQTERRVDLERGEAFFDDVKDPHRPFVVYVGDKRVVAVGTAFSVDRDKEDIRVVVIQGQVRLEDSRAGSATAARVRGEQALRGRGNESPHSQIADVVLNPGTVARATGGDFLVQNISLVQAEQDLSWRSGYLTFHDTTLADAVNQLNRYNSHKIVITDSTVATIRISGTFRPTDYESFIHLLQKAYSIRAAASEGETDLGR